ncbi:LytR/AlgR family response regulator transcription factor [Flectobacillus roseus]|uniref:LytR/AlgR family response regulator transcription factor n=1 Tax=Flectobacillus roseus TaxID=502259 RepID=UPI0024B85F89|nr:LytTR family DNA-binding domain-containing protein [Flectobacillus roseus]MDI9870846.1 LytTR family DNA-binding domain-containing protein [Flectobacillus roseus]
MKAILIDDELHNLTNLQVLLNTYCPQVEVCALAQSAEQGKKAVKTYLPDLIFLDIQMPEQDGFAFLRSLDYYNFEVIFVTAYDQYAIQAMRFSAVDYLLKPINIKELVDAVNRASKQNQLKNQHKQIEYLMDWFKVQSQKEEQRIALSTVEETRFAKVSEIIRCESSNNYTTFFLSDNSKLLVSKPIYEYDELLSNYGFIRCHQSHLVNKAYIKSWLKEYGDFLLLNDGMQIPISRGKKQMVKEALRM